MSNTETVAKNELREHNSSRNAAGYQFGLMALSFSAGGVIYLLMGVNTVMMIPVTLGIGFGTAVAIVSLFVSRWICEKLKKHLAFAWITSAMMLIGSTLVMSLQHIEFIAPSLLFGGIYLALKIAPHRQLAVA
jgi:hypothetical protein